MPVTMEPAMVVFHRLVLRSADARSITYPGICGDACLCSQGERGELTCELLIVAESRKDCCIVVDVVS